MPSIVKVNEISSTNASVTPVTVKSHMDLETTKDILNARDITVNRDVTIGGNLTVNGATSTIESTTLQIKDKNIELAKATSPTDASADGGGITLKGTTDKTFNWVDATDAWTSSEHMNLVSTKEFKINGTTVLSSTQVLGKAVPTGDIVGTSDSQNLTNKTINNITYPATDGTNGQVLVTNGSGVLSFSTLATSFITRQTNALANDGTVSISSLFGSQVSGSYRFFDLNDPRISGTIFLKHNGSSSDPDVRVDSNSSTVSITINTASSLNVYIASNVVTFQNKTGSAVSLVVYKEV